MRESYTITSNNLYEKNTYNSSVLSVAAYNGVADGPFRHHRYDAFKALRVNSDNIVFVGNSITNMHEWCEAFGNPKVLNRGNSDAFSQAATTIFFNANFSNVFKVVEVPYYNAPEFVSVQGEGWETLYLLFVTVIPEGVTASTGRIEDGKLKLTAIEGGVLPANTAVLLQGTEGKHVFAPSTTAGTPVEDNAFWGTIDASAEAPANLYALGEKNGWAAFKSIGTEAVQPAKAYLAGASDEVEAYFISLPTSIEGAAVINGKAAPTYDLSGRRVNKPSRGIYLQNSKKVILR